MEVNKHIVVAELGDLGLFIEFETVEPFLASNDPLFGCRGWHLCYGC